MRLFCNVATRACERSGLIFCSAVKR